MTNSDSHHPEPPLEEIVAYLDGELSSDENAQVERRLSADEAYRRQMQSFDRVWSALDELPAEVAGDRFSKTTMELLVDAAEQEVRQQTEALPRLRRKRSMTGSLFVVAAVLSGFLGARWFHTDPNRMLIDDLPVIEHVDIYSQFQSIDFLRQLQKTLGDDHWASGPQSEQLAAAGTQEQAGQWEQTNSSSKRRRWIDHLSPDHQLTLRTKFNRFRAFSPPHQQRLRQLQQQLIAAPDADRLQATMSQYQQWLDDQPLSRQFELREMSEDQRVQAIVRQVRARRSQGRLELTANQIDQMAQKIQRQMPDIRAHFQAKMSQKDRRYLATLAGHKRWWAMLRWMMQHHSAVAEPLRADMLSVLTESQHEQFQQLSHQDQRKLLFEWLLRAGRFHHSSRGNLAVVGEQDLENFYAEELDAGLKEELLALPRDAMRNRLERLYWGMDGRPGFEGPPDRPPGPPDPRLRDGRPRPVRRHPPQDAFRRHDRGARYEQGPGPRGP